MALCQLELSGLPKTIATFEAARREWVLGLTLPSGSVPEETVTAYTEAQQSLSNVLKRKGGAWVVGAIRYVLTPRGIQVENAPESIPDDKPTCDE